SRSDLVAQSVTQTASTQPGFNSGVRTVSQNPICWKGTAPSCTQFGFYLDLPGANEQVDYSPLEVGGVLIVNSTVPADNSASSCTSSPSSGWTMAIDATTGGGLPPT